MKKNKVKADVKPVENGINVEQLKQMLNDASVPSSSTKNTTDIVRSLNGMYNKLNKKYFQGKLPHASILLCRPKNHKCMSYFREKKDVELFGQKTYEIGISVNYMHNFRMVISSLLHEMIHIFNVDVLKIIDCSLNGKHKREFRDSCLSIGMTCDLGTQGYNDTGLTDVMFAEVTKIWNTGNYTFDILAPVDFESTVSTRKKGGVSDDGKINSQKPKPKPKSMVKWVCPKCSVNFQVKVKLTSVQCGCGVYMKSKIGNRLRDTLDKKGD